MSADADLWLGENVGINQFLLGLVAQTLLVAVLLHTLLALVLVDLGFAAFLDGSHVEMWLGLTEKLLKSLWNNLVERILNDALSTQQFEFGNDVANDDFVNHCLDSYPAFLRKTRNGGTTK